MSTWQFLSDVQGWSSVSWVSGEGSPAPGCIEVGPPYGVINGLALPITGGASFSCKIRLIVDDPTPKDYSVSINLNAYCYSQNIYTDPIELIDTGVTSYDSGWVTLSGVIPLNDTLDSIYVNYDWGAEGNALTHVYVDTVLVAESLGSRFYTGPAGSFTYRSDLPFDSIEPGGLAVSSGLVAIVGNANPAADVVVARATGGDDYAAWTDITGSLDDTTPIKALAWIND